MYQSSRCVPFIGASQYVSAFAEVTGYEDFVRTLRAIRNSSLRAISLGCQISTVDSIVAKASLVDPWAIFSAPNTTVRSDRTALSESDNTSNINILPLHLILAFCTLFAKLAIRYSAEILHEPLQICHLQRLSSETIDVSGEMRVGFLGLGTMGLPMALNLCREFPITVWNRNPSKYPILTQAGASVGESPSDVARKSDIIFSMLFDGAAIQSILNEDFKKALRGKTLINTSSVSVNDSQNLADYVHDAGGHFIEMPVSGSKVPAELGQLVGMIAGDKAIAEYIAPTLKPITSAAVYCGPIGSGLKTKYAINLYLFAITAGLAESMNLARAQGVDLGAFGQVLNAGPLASAYTKTKIPKMLDKDWSAHAAIKDGYNNTQLIQEAASAAEAHAPIMQVCNALYKQANETGFGEEDLVAIYKLFSYEKR